MLRQAVASGHDNLLPRFGERCMSVVRKKIAAIRSAADAREVIPADGYMSEVVSFRSMGQRMMAPMNGRDGYDAYRIPAWLQQKIDRGTATVPSPTVMASILRREKELRLSPRVQAANSHPATDDLAVTHQLQLQAVREHGLHDDTIHMLRAAHDLCSSDNSVSKGTAQRDGNDDLSCPGNGMNVTAQGDSNGSLMDNGGLLEIPHYRKFNCCEQGSMLVGDVIPDIALHHLDGTPTALSCFQTAGRPLVLFAGSFT